MMNDSADAQILSQEQRAIERLASETGIAIPQVQEIFLTEYKKLAVLARVKAYVPLLVGNCVKSILDAQKNARNCPAIVQTVARDPL
jgi:hypothetical protein